MKPYTLRIRESEVSLTTEQHAAADTHPAQAMVALHCGSATLLARITQRAEALLDLQPGTPMWAQVKSVVVLA